MGTSEHWQIPRVIEALIREQPGSVLDVGAGYGKFGVLVREYVKASRVDMFDVGPPRYPVYDHVYEGDLLHIEKILPPDAGPYDLALFIETIEHLEKADGWRILEALTARARRVLVTTPFGFRPQQIEGLPYETHRSGWYPWEFGKRFKVHSLQIYPGHYTKRLHIPRMWQILAVLSARDGGSLGKPSNRR